MSVIINPIITNAVLNVFTPMATGIEFTFTHVAVGTGTSAVNANATALQNEIARFTIAGGGVIAGGKAVSINALVTNHANANPQDYDISEVGFYGLDGNNNTVLFAIHRQSTTIVRKVAGADIALPFVLGLSALPAENMTVTIDTNTSGALALLGQHTAANHPHPPYKRTLDNTERLKIAPAVDADDAIRKDELDALRLRLIANGIDADLAVTNNATGLDFNDNQFKVAGTWYFDYALNTSIENVSGIITVKKAGNKVYQHEILENGQAANRVFTGIQWLPWVYQTGAIQGVVTFISVDDYADLNDFNTAGYFTFSTSDNLLHAPPTQGLESDYELQVLVTPNSGTIQIVKNITTNASFIRVKESGSWPNTWTLTPPIEHIVTNANIDGIRSEGVYLCTYDTNTGLPDMTDSAVFILYVKNSSAYQTVVQVLIKISGNYAALNMPLGQHLMPYSTILYREVVDTGLADNHFFAWKSLRLLPAGPYGGYSSSYGQQEETYYANLNAFMLRNININQLFSSNAVYVFTLNDNISNLPPSFSEDNGFCFLFTERIDSNMDGYFEDTETTAQYIFQYNGLNTGSGVYTRSILNRDWLNNNPPTAWTLVT